MLCCACAFDHAACYRDAQRSPLMKSGRHLDDSVVAASVGPDATTGERRADMKEFSMRNEPIGKPL